MKTLKTRSELRSMAVGDIDTENRIALFSAASEYPVERYDPEQGDYYQEILSFDDGDVDLSRMSGAPVLDTHYGDQIGVVESCEIRDRKLYVKAKYSNASPRANEIFQDIADGIRRNISIGYLKTAVRCCGTDAQQRRTVRFAWQPYEVSHVTIPADPTIGVGRNGENGEFRQLPLPAEHKNLKQIIIY